MTRHGLPGHLCMQGSAMNFAPRRAGPTTAALLLGLLVVVAHAQKLPEPTRTVYKCTVDGKVVYTDEPCAGAKKVDVEPTRGLNRSSGRERIGADVSRERNDEVLSDALRPLNGPDARQMAIARRRQGLSVPARLECAALDQRVPRVEAQERAASGPAMAGIQAELLAHRKRQRALRC